MQSNPVLAELVRGNMVENIHRGAFVLVEDTGRIVASAGDRERMIFPRSAIKAIQALAIFRSGAAEKFHMTAAELALACASHFGEPDHVTTASTLLTKLGLTEADLECGAHPPTDKAARQALREAGQKPNSLHNNCSGKHAGMLAVAKALGVDTKGYVERDHQVQRLVRQCISDVLGYDVQPSACGTDGCSIPTWGAPLRAFAHAFAKMATGSGISEQDASAAHILFDAAIGNPHLVAGTEAIDTLLMEAFGDRLMLKTGAEGVFCGALRDQGVGFALKVDDGNMLASRAMLAEMLKRHANPSATELAALEAFRVQVQKNWQKREVAVLRAAEHWPS